MQIVVQILNTGVFAHKPSTLADGGWLGILFGYDSVIGYVLSEALTIYQTVWFILSWRRIYVQVLERNGFHKVDTDDTINELSN